MQVWMLEYMASNITCETSVFSVNGITLSFEKILYR